MTSNLYPHEFWLKVSQYQDAHPALRQGQCVYDVLRKHRPGLARHIVDTDLDPYDNDAALPVLSEWLARHWLDTFE